MRQKLGLPMDDRGPRHIEAVAAAQSVTAEELREFVKLCSQRYDAKRMDPGTHTQQLSSCGREFCLPVIYTISGSTTLWPTILLGSR